jgi:hypothetical protein
VLAAKLEEEEKGRELLRIINRKEREKMMELGKMVEDSTEAEVKDLVGRQYSIPSSRY